MCGCWAAGQVAFCGTIATSAVWWLKVGDDALSKFLYSNQGTDDVHLGGYLNDFSIRCSDRDESQNMVMNVVDSRNISSSRLTFREHGQASLKDWKAQRDSIYRQLPIEPCSTFLRPFTLYLQMSAFAVTVPAAVSWSE